MYNIFASIIDTAILKRPL